MMDDKNDIPPEELTEEDFGDFIDDGADDADDDDGTEAAERTEDTDAPDRENYVPTEEDETDVLNAKETEKGEHEKNDGSFLNRNMLFVTVGTLFIIFLFFAVFILPALTKRKEAKNNELDKAGKVFIPDAYEEDVLEDDEENPDWRNSNSSAENYLELIEDGDSTSIPSIDNNRTAPVPVPEKMGTAGNGAGQQSTVPQTNRNELQKAMQRVPFSGAGESAAVPQKSGGYPVPSYMTGSSSYSTGGGYTPAALQSNVGAYLASQNASSYERQNDQSGKEEFMNRNTDNAGSYQWNSDFTLWKGTVIPAVLDIGINTDLPGFVTATVTTNVYSSNNGRYLLIPQGSRLFAEYNSSVSYGQNRIQVAWNTLIRPDGLEINLGSVAGVDARGYAGYKAYRTEHPFEYAKALGLIALFSIIDTKASNTINAQNNTYAQNALSDAYSTAQKLNEKIIDRALDIQATLRKKSGEEVKLITNITMELPPLEPYPVEQKYVRN